MGRPGPNPFTLLAQPAPTRGRRKTHLKNPLKKNAKKRPGHSPNSIVLNRAVARDVFSGFFFSCWAGISVGHGKYIGKGGLSRDDDWPIRECGIWPSAYNGMFNMY
jgi:hypothetical protein